MQSPQNSLPHNIPFIDYVPAEIKETAGENWRIVFYARNPDSDQMQRFRRRVKKVSGIQQRMHYAKRICIEVYSKLQEGWSPFHEKEYQMLTEIMNLFIEQCERRFRDNLLRKDSLRSYISYSQNIINYLKATGRTEMFTVEFTKKFVLEYLNYIYFEKKRTARTSNNYLAFCNLLATFMKDREYLSINPTIGIARRKVGKKVRQIIPAEIRNGNKFCIGISIFIIFS